MEGEGGDAVVVPSLEEMLSKDQVSWAQCLLEASYFESCFSPKSAGFSPRFSSPKGGNGVQAGFPEFLLGSPCPSPLLSDQLKLLHSWNSRVTKQAEEAVSTTSVSSGSEACMSTAEVDKVGSDHMPESGDAGVPEESLKRKLLVPAEEEEEEDSSPAEEEKNSP